MGLSVLIIGHAHDVAFEADVSAVVQCSRGFGYLGRVEIFVLVRGHRGVEIGDKRRDGHIVTAVVGGAEQVADRFECEVQPTAGTTRLVSGGGNRKNWNLPSTFRGDCLGPQSLADDPRTRHRHRLLRLHRRRYR